MLLSIKKALKKALNQHNQLTISDLGGTLFNAQFIVNKQVDFSIKNKQLTD